MRPEIMWPLRSKPACVFLTTALDCISPSKFIENVKSWHRGSVWMAKTVIWLVTMKHIVFDIKTVDGILLN